MAIIISCSHGQVHARTIIAHSLTDIGQTLCSWTTLVDYLEPTYRAWSHRWLPQACNLSAERLISCFSFQNSARKLSVIGHFLFLFAMRKLHVCCQQPVSLHSAEWTSAEWSRTVLFRTEKSTEQSDKSTPR